MGSQALALCHCRDTYTSCRPLSSQEPRSAPSESLSEWGADCWAPGPVIVSWQPRHGVYFFSTTPDPGGWAIRWEDWLEIGRPLPLPLASPEVFLHDVQILRLLIKRSSVQILNQLANRYRSRIGTENPLSALSWQSKQMGTPGLGKGQNQVSRAITYPHSHMTDADECV